VVVVLLVGGLAYVLRSGDDGASDPNSLPAPVELSGDPTGSAAGAGTTAPTTAEDGLGAGWAPEQDGRRALRGFSEVLVTFTDSSGETCEACLLAATEDAQRSRGLMEVTDAELGGYDGMLFEYPDEITGAFWMRNTPMPLSIAYFDDSRNLVSTADMAPCEDSPDCRGYPADAPFQYALEVAQGGLADLLVADGTTLTIDARTCQRATGG